MIVWRGLGILSLLIPFALGIFLSFQLGDNDTSAGIGYLLGAIPVWFLGRRWNQKIPPIPLAREGEEPVYKHSAFWIHAEYWAVLWSITGIMNIVSGQYTPLPINMYFAVIGGFFVAFGFYQHDQAKKFRNQLIELQAAMQAKGAQEL